jgi:hypothetical protein
MVVSSKTPIGPGWSCAHSDLAKSQHYLDWEWAGGDFPQRKSKLLLSKEGWMAIEQARTAFLNQIPRHLNDICSSVVMQPGCNPIRNCQATVELLLTWPPEKWAQPGAGLQSRAHKSDTAFSIPQCWVNPLGTGKPSVEIISGFPSELFKDALSFDNVSFPNIVQMTG